MTLIPPSNSGKDSDSIGNAKTVIASGSTARFQELRIGELLYNGQYRLEQKIDRGTFGEIWRATRFLDSRAPDTVALKFLRSDISTEAVNRVAQLEVETIQKIQQGSHPGKKYIIYATRFVHATERHGPFLDLEWMSGGNLGKTMERTDWQPEALWPQYAMQIIKAIACSHHAGIVHGDIKPTNVLLNGERTRCKLADFGISRTLEDSKPKGWGSPQYMSPESFPSAQGTKNMNDRILDLEKAKKSDVYSLGVLLYQMAERRRPFPDAPNPSAYARIHHENIPASLSVTWLKQESRQLILSCLDKNPDFRPTAEGLLHHFESYDSNSFLDEPDPSVLEWIETRNGRSLRHRETGIRFIPLHGGQFYIPESPLTHADYLKFIRSPNNSLWYPTNLPANHQDGGYLEDWIHGVPLSSDQDNPLSGIPHAAASAFARWLGGDLPSTREMEQLEDQTSPGFLPILQAWQQQRHPEIPVHIWCREEVPVSGATSVPLWRCIPPDRLFKTLLQKAMRPGFYCLPYLYTTVIITARSAKIAMDERASSLSGLPRPALSNPFMRRDQNEGPTH